MAKAKAYVAHKPHIAVAVALCVTDSAGVQIIGRRLSLRPQALSYDPTVIRSPSLPFNGVHRRNPWIVLVSRPGGMEG